MNAGDQFGYDWVNDTSEFATGSCFAFFDQLSVEQATSSTGITEWRYEDLRAADSAPVHQSDAAVAFFSQQGWTIGYEPNGYPDRFANRLAARADVARAVIVYWNINAVTEFAYWEYGTQIVSFDWPQDRIGSEPDRLVEKMRDTVGLHRGDDDVASVFEIYQRMLALAERITGVRLGADFLRKASVAVGYSDDDDAEDYDAKSVGSEWSGPRPWSTARSSADPVQAALAADRPAWVADERKLNEQALRRIPTDRWNEIPARLARLACERVGIAQCYPVDEILNDLDHGRRPHPAQLTSRWDLMAEVEYAIYGQGQERYDRARAAVEAIFLAAKANSRRAPLDVLREARTAINDQGTEAIDQVRADITSDD